MLRQLNSSNKLSNIDGKRRRIIIKIFLHQDAKNQRQNLEFIIVYYWIYLSFFRVIYNLKKDGIVIEKDRKRIISKSIMLKINKGFTDGSVLVMFLPLRQFFCRCISCCRVLVLPFFTVVTFFFFIFPLFLFSFSIVEITSFTFQRIFISILL